MSIKGRAIKLIETSFGVHVIRPREVARLFEIAHLRRFFERFGVDCVFDVGANAGQYARMLREKVGYNGPIVSYEPIPAVVARLHEQAKDNSNWYVVGAALDQTAGRKTFNIMKNDRFSSLHDPSADEVGIFTENKMNTVIQQVEVETRALCGELETFSRTIGFKHPFLKMDSQGNDIAIAAGAGPRLHDFVGIQTELAIKRIYEGIPDFAAAIEFLRSRDFEISALVPNNEGHFPQLIEMDAIFVRRDLLSNP